MAKRKRPSPKRDLSIAIRHTVLTVYDPELARTGDWTVALARACASLHRAGHTSPAVADELFTVLTTDPTPSGAPRIASLA